MTEPTTNPAAPADDEQAATIGETFPVYNVLIERDASTKIPATLPFYELPIVESIYGEDHVIVIGEDEIEGEIDARIAYDNLVAKYEKHENAVKAIYPSVHMFARQAGLKLGGETAARRQPQSLSKVHAPAKKATKAATGKKASK